MDDVIKLVASTGYTSDAAGNRIPIETVRQVFCQVRSIGRNEFYQAAQNNLHPEFVFVLSHYKDYEGETLIRFAPWGSTEEKTYSVIRTYRLGDSDELEIVVEERIGNG